MKTLATLLAIRIGRKSVTSESVFVSNNCYFWRSQIVKIQLFTAFHKLKLMKNRTTAALLSLFLGVFGMQFFYLNRTGLGIFMIILSTAMRAPQIAFFIGFVNFLVLLFMRDEDFNAKYNKKWWADQQNNRQIPVENAPPKTQRQQERNERQQNREARERMKPTAVGAQNKPSSSAQKEAIIQSGIKKYKEYDYDSAIEDFGKALAIEPRNVAVHWNLTCLYSLTEQKELAFYHLQKAVEFGFRDYDKVKSHDALAYLRVQPEFEAFARNGFKLPEDMEHSEILQQLKDISTRREQGLLSEKEFADMSRRILE